MTTTIKGQILQPSRFYAQAYVDGKPNQTYWDGFFANTPEVKKQRAVSETILGGSK